MQRLSIKLMHPDKLTTNIEKLKKFIDEKASNESQKKKPIKENRDHKSELSKAGLKNTHDGIRSSINYTKNTLKESTMIIPIKQIILEFTADHIRDNAGKYAAGTMLGLGAAAGYLAGDPDHGSHLMDNHESNGHSQYPAGTTNPVHYDTRSDFQKDLAKNVQSTNTEYHNQNRGIIGNLTHGLGMGVDNLRHENKFNDLTDKQNDYNESLNSEGNLLTSGQKWGAGLAGAGYLAAKSGLRIRRK